MFRLTRKFVVTSFLQFINPLLLAARNTCSGKSSQSFSANEQTPLSSSFIFQRFIHVGKRIKTFHHFHVNIRLSLLRFSHSPTLVYPFTSTTAGSIDPRHRCTRSQKRSRDLHTIRHIERIGKRILRSYPTSRRFFPIF